MTPRLEHLRRALDTVLGHPAMQLSTAMQFLTFDGRSVALNRQINSFNGLGAPATALEHIYTELREWPPRSTRVDRLVRTDTNP